MTSDTVLMEFWSFASSVLGQDNGGMYDNSLKEMIKYFFIKMISGKSPV